MKKTLLILLIFLYVFNVHGQKLPSDQNHRLAKAEMFLNSRSKNYNPVKAFSIYEELAEEGNGYSMTVLGALYQKGKGTSINYKKALYWFERSANTGFFEAYAKIANIYKQGFGTPQDFNKAFYYFEKGRNQGSIHCTYMLGFMYYKGLGCKQNYNKAVELFNESSEKGSPWGTYMSGICFRNGYGVTLNLDSAKRYLQKAASLGIQPAKEELLLPKAENWRNQLKSNPEKVISNVPNDSRKIALKRGGNLKSSEIMGTYDGFITRYDWSKQYVIGESKLSLRLLVSGKEITGEWIEDDTIGTPINATLADSGLVFQDTYYKKEEHYSKQAVMFHFNKASLYVVKNGDSVLIAGNLQLFSHKLKEPEKPIFISLVKRQEAIVKNNGKILNTVVLPGSLLEEKSFVAFPNPVDNSFNVRFSVDQSSLVSLGVYNTSGKLCLTKEWNLSIGNYEKSIDASFLTPGFYVLKFRNNSKIVTTGIIKN